MRNNIAMHRCFVSGLPLLLLLLGCRNAFAEGSELEKILVFAGEPAILPCTTDVTKYVPTVEWSKDGLENIVFLFKDHFEDYNMKIPAYEFRTNLFMREVWKGNVSLRISNVQLSDAGIYNCRTIHGEKIIDVTIQLVVVAISRPILSSVPADGAGVTVQCEAFCWYPKPQMMLLDDSDNKISAEEQKSENSSGCFTVTMKATLQTCPKRVGCRVDAPNVSLTRVTDFIITGPCMSSCTATMFIAVAVTLILCGLSLCVAYVCKKCFAEGGKWSWCMQFCQPTTPARGEARNEAGNHCSGVLSEDQISTAELQRKIADQKQEISDKNRIIESLTAQLQEALSQLFAHNGDHGTLEGEISPQSNDANASTSRGSIQSCPAPSIDTSPVSPLSYSTSAPGSVFRSLSLSLPSRHSARPKRRYTTSIMGNMGHIADVNEETDLLQDYDQEIV